MAVSEAFERARRIKRQMSGALLNQRPEMRQRAIEAYEKVYEYASGTDPHGVEAAFRVGELARAGGEFDRAWSAFERAAIGIPCVLAYRARVELGHLARRRGEADLAMRQYQKLLMSPCEEPYVRDVALFWLARVQCESGRKRAAVDTLEQLRTRLDHGPLFERVERDLKRFSKDTNAVGSDVQSVESPARMDFF